MQQKQTVLYGSNILDNLCRQADLLRELGCWDFVVTRSEAHFWGALSTGLVIGDDNPDRTYAYPFYRLFPQKGGQVVSRDAMLSVWLCLLGEFLEHADAARRKHNEGLPPKKRMREPQRQPLMMRFSPNKIQRVSEEDGANKSLCV